MELNKCFGCMEEIQGYPCPHCGFDPRRVTGIEYALPMGTILAGKYLVGRVLGQGGFGITYVGWDIALERKVAIKEYYPSGQVSRNPGSRGLTWYTSVQSQQAKQNGTQMFLKEARKMSKVDDIPNVVRVRDLFQENETAYIVMDFVEGETLKARLEKTGPLPWEQAKGIFLPAIQAMEQVHQAGLVHRDISPDNLMLTPDGRVKILDLGAAKDLSVNNGASSMQVAKGGFSPFEQYTQRGSSGPWTDVYAMAATVYYTLTGKLPPVATDRVVEDTISWEEPGLKALSAQALEALQKAMVISAKTRMQSMEELEKGLYSTTVKPEPAPAPQPMQETQPEPQPAPETKPESQPEQEVKPEPKPTPEPTPQAKTEPKPEAGKKSGKKLWIAAAAVIAVVLCGALVWANAGKPADDTDTAVLPATTPATTPTVATTAAPTVAPTVAATAATTVAPTTTATVAEEASSQPMFYGINMTPEEFEQEFDLLLDAAKSWTKATAPQNIKDFPIFPESLFELFDTLEGAQSEIEIADSTLTWKSNIFELLPEDLASVGTIERSFEYWNKLDERQLAFESVGNGTYSVQAPTDAWTSNASPCLYFLCRNYLDGWTETLQVSYDIPNKRIEGVPLVGISMLNAEYVIGVCRNLLTESNYRIELKSITGNTLGGICSLTYDAASGKLISVTKP